MKRCEECGQLVPPSDAEIMAVRMECYISAKAMLREAWGQIPSHEEVESAARFLAGDPPADVVIQEGEDE